MNSNAEPGRIAAVVFDMDGVLIDSEPIWERARRDVVATFGGTYTDTATRDVMGMSAPEWSRYLHDALGVPLEPERINEEVVARVAAAYRQNLPLMDHAAVVGMLARTYPLAIASSSNRSLIELVLELAGMREMFSVVVSSEEVARGKPAPDVYLRAAELLGVESHACAAIEDSNNGILSASAAGMHVIAVPTAEHPPKPETLELAERVIGNLAELASAVERISQPHLFPSRIADDDVIAKRVLKANADDERTFEVTVLLGRPMQNGAEWFCFFSADGPDGSILPGAENGKGSIRRALGADAFSSLINATQALRYEFDRSGIELSWFEEEPGWHGFPRFIMGWSPKMERHLVSLVDAEVERLSSMLQNRETYDRAREIIGPPRGVNRTSDPLR